MIRITYLVCMAMGWTSNSRHANPWRVDIGSTVLSTIFVGAVQESVVELEFRHFEVKR